MSENWEDVLDELDKAGFFKGDKSKPVDIMHLETNKQIKRTSKRLAQEYKQAEKELKKKTNEYLKQFKKADKEKAKMVKDGLLSQSEYLDWRKNKILYSEKMKKQVESMSQYLANVDKQAANIINKALPDVYAMHHNWGAYQIEHGFGINAGFTLFDEKTIERMAAKNPRLLPKMNPTKAKEQKVQAWSRRKINQAISQGILQGEAIDSIADRLTKVVGMEWNQAVRNARTAMTGAQNAGRLDSYEQATKLGINVQKQWMATLDERTRESHADLDGTSVPVDEPFVTENGNELMIPADPDCDDPSEIYNCRCTMVADLIDYPDEGFERYVNGESVGDMTYNEWYSAKKAEETLSKAASIDYSKYGGKEMFGLFADSKDAEDLFFKMVNDKFDEYHELEKKYGMDGLDDLVKKAKAEKATIEAAEKIKETQKAAKETAKLKKELTDAEKSVKKLEAEIKANGADKVFKNIWKDDVTYADWGAKKAGIQGKKDYFKQQIASGKDVTKFEGLLKDLEEFEKYGEEYSKLLKEYSAAQKALSDIKLKTIVKEETYSKARKDAAVWCKRVEDADSVLRERCGNVWRNATKTERESIYEYTKSYHKFNEPLRGIEYGTERYLGVGNTNLNAANNGKFLNAMTDIIDKSTYDHDMWFNRGCGFKGMDKFFGVDERLLKNGTQEELEAALLGTTPTEYGFMSMGSAKGQGFGGNIKLNIYAPAGTKMMYVEPFSAFGHGSGYAWDGIAKQHSFGRELETILQQNTQFRVTRVERSGGTLYVDLDVIAQNTPQRWKP